MLKNLDKLQNVRNNASKENLSLKERQALEQLKSNEHIVIKPADKGGNIVIMRREDYVTEANSS